MTVPASTSSTSPALAGTVAAAIASTAAASESATRTASVSDRIGALKIQGLDVEQVVGTTPPAASLSGRSVSPARSPSEPAAAAAAPAEKPKPPAKKLQASSTGLVPPTEDSTGAKAPARPDSEERPSLGFGTKLFLLLTLVAGVAASYFFGLKKGSQKLFAIGLTSTLAVVSTIYVLRRPKAEAAGFDT